jgi:hypothetical protein
MVIVGEPLNGVYGDVRRLALSVFIAALAGAVLSVQAHGGMIRFESVHDQGTTFLVELAADHGGMSTLRRDPSATVPAPGEYPFIRTCVGPLGRT